MSEQEQAFSVRAVHCDYTAAEEEVYQALKRATDPLTRAWERLEKAGTIGIKFNQDKRPANRVYYEGHLQQLVSHIVGRAVLRLLRERTKAELYCLDVSFYTMYLDATLEQTTTYAELLEEFRVPYISGIHPPYTRVEVPGGGLMFSNYLLPSAVNDMDEFVSVATLKSHAFMGVTLTLKNLFGLMPGLKPAHHRTYFHHLVRMPYMLADLGRMIDPALNIVDGLVSQAGSEWGTGAENGATRICNTLIAGDHTIATDACAAYLMGHDPQSDWLTEPFHRDRNSLLVAAEGGFGTVNLDEIDFHSEVTAPVGEYYAVMTDSKETIVSWRRTTAEQALLYREDPHPFFDQYAGQYILLQDGEVRWHNENSILTESRRILARNKPDQAMWFKYVDPDEQDGEHFDVYEYTLANMPASSEIVEETK